MRPLGSVVVSLAAVYSCVSLEPLARWGGWAISASTPAPALFALCAVPVCLAQAQLRRGASLCLGQCEGWSLWLLRIPRKFSQSARSGAVRN